MHRPLPDHQKLFVDPRLGNTAVADNSINTIKKEVAVPKLMFSLATDGSSDKEDKFFPVLITYEDKAIGMITTAFLDMPVVNEATGHNIKDVMQTSLQKIVRKNAGNGILETLEFKIFWWDMP